MGQHPARGPGKETLHDCRDSLWRAVARCLHMVTHAHTGCPNYHVDARWRRAFEGLQTLELLPGSLRAYARYAWGCPAMVVRTLVSASPDVLIQSFGPDVQSA